MAARKLYHKKEKPQNDSHMNLLHKSSDEYHEKRHLENHHSDSYQHLDGDSHHARGFELHGTLEFAVSKFTGKKEIIV